MAAAVKTFRNGVWNGLADLKVFRNGAWRKLKTLKVYSGGAWRLVGNFIPPLSLSISPSEVFGSAASGSPTNVTTTVATATPSGGVGPYSYAWDAGGAGVTASQPTMAATTFTKNMPAFTTAHVFPACVVTDSLGATASASCEADLDNFGG